MQIATINFLSSLAANNNKGWFDGHRDEYEAAKNDFEQFVAGILTGLSGLDPAFKEQKAKDCIFRIYRDVRFSKDKSPYKTAFGAYFSKSGGKAHTGAGYYVHAQPDKSFVGGGIWMPENPILKILRQEIDYNFENFKSIIEDKKFVKTFGTVQGEQLKKMPTGYAEDNPAGHYLKLKSFTVQHEFKNDEVVSNKFTDKCTDIFNTMQPLINFLNKAVTV